LTFAQAEQNISIMLRPLICATLFSLDPAQKKNLIRCLSHLMDTYKESNGNRRAARDTKKGKDATDTYSGLDPLANAYLQQNFLPSLYRFLPFCWGAGLHTDSMRHNNLADSLSAEYIGKERFLDMSQVSTPQR